MLAKNSASIAAIPLYREKFIRSRLKMFINDYKIKEWPIDCLMLLEKIVQSCTISLQFGMADAGNGFEAMSRYIEGKKLYQIILNKNKITYPFKASKDRRLNFTIAHELGHVFLDHLSIPSSVKTRDEIILEDLEADEFAGMLLMPGRILSRCSFNSYESAAEFFNVSESALAVRLSLLSKEDFLGISGKFACSVCGNTQKTATAVFCRICGSSIEKRSRAVIRAAYFDGIRLDRMGTAMNCPCCNELSDGLSGKCGKCGTILLNICSEGLHRNSGNARYCEICGQATHFLKAGFLRPWDE